MEQVAFDCAVLEFYEEITKQPLLLKYHQQVSVSKYFPNEKNIYIHDPVIVSYNLHFRQVSVTLCLGNGKITLFGKCVNQLVKEDTIEVIGYFHSSNELEMHKIMEGIIDGDHVYEYIWNSDVITIRTVPSNITLGMDLSSNIPNIIHNMKSSEMKHSWDPINGYYCTIVAGLISSLDLCDNNIISKEIYYSHKVDIRQILLTKYIYFVKANKQCTLCKDILVRVFGILINTLVTNAKIMLISKD